MENVSVILMERKRGSGRHIEKERDNERGSERERERDG